MILAIIYCALAAIFGIIFCFFGYRDLKKLFIGFGFLIGALLAFVLLSPVLSPVLAIIVSVLIGALVGILLYYLMVVGMFITGACLGVIAVITVCLLVGWDCTTTIAYIIMGVVSITFGVLSVIFRRGLIIIGTSFTGAYMLVLNAGFLFTSMNSSVSLNNLSDNIGIFFGSNTMILALTALALGLAGMIIQFTLTAPGRKSRGRKAK